MPKRLLISWIGHNDLRPMAQAQPEAVREQIFAEIGQGSAAGGVGPVKTLLDAEAFDKVVLLADLKPEWTTRYATWVGGSPSVERVQVGNPTDYKSIFETVDRVLGKLRKAGTLKSHELCIHLSPGTPAMTAVWVLLGKSKYPATFYQTHQGQSWITDVPFDLKVDFLPELYSNPDRRLQHLAAELPAEVAGFEAIIGTSERIRLAVGRSRRAAVRSVPVLLLGESGVGKELFARAIHQSSPRAGKPFFAINCAAISRELLESELFGHKKGAFTGATEDRLGAFAQADGGTLFLDEIGECDQSLQAKLLRVLEPPAEGTPSLRRFRPVGAAEERSSDVRIVAATNRDLVAEINAGRFREDLYYRLAVVTINLPPLRERKQDIPALAEALMNRINRQLSAEGEPGYEHKSLSDAASRIVMQREWRGNIRQLYNALLQAAVMADDDVLDRLDIEAAVGEMAPLPGDRADAFGHPLGEGFDLEEHLNTIRRHYLRRAMEEAKGVKAEASRLLGITHYQTLDNQLKRLSVTGDWS